MGTLAGKVLTEDEVRHAMDIEGIAVKGTTEHVLPIYTGWTRLETLYHFGTTHLYWHGGEVCTIEGLMK